MRPTTILTMSVVLAASPLTAWAQPARQVQDTGFQNSRITARGDSPIFEKNGAAQQPTDSRPVEKETAPVETLLLRTDFEVAGEQVRLWQTRLEDGLSDSQPEAGDISNVAAYLIERLEEWLRMGQALGRETPDLRPLRRLGDEIKLVIASLEAERVRKEYERARNACPPAPPILRFRRTTDLIDACLKLLGCQLRLSDRLDVDEVAKARVKARLEESRSRAAALEQAMNKALETMEDQQRQVEAFGRHLSTSSRDAERLPEDLHRLVEEANQLLIALRASRRQRDRVSSEATDLANSVLAASKELLRRVQPAAADEGTEAKLRMLMTRRLALLREQLTEFETKLQLGLPGVSRVGLSRTSELLLKAELDLCGTRVERIARYRKQVEAMRRWEEQMKAELRAGIVGALPEEDVRRVEIARLEAEIGLQRELIDAKAPAKASAAPEAERGKEDRGAGK